MHVCADVHPFVLTPVVMYARIWFVCVLLAVKGTLMSLSWKTEKIDRRIMHTKNAICNALMELMSYKDINAITVRELSETANISRKTFYNYYSSVHEVLSEIEAGLLEIMDDKMAHVRYADLLNDPTKMLTRVTETIEENPTFYRFLLNINSSDPFIQRLYGEVKGRLKNSMRSQLTLSDRHLDILIEYHLPAIINVYKLCLNRATDFSVEEISHLVSMNACRGSYGYYNMVKESY